MNIVLSCYANKGKASFVLEKGGKVINKEVFSLNKNGKEHLKEFIFEAIIRGLKNTRPAVRHEDLLLIKVQNSNIVDWLNGGKEYKGYESYLDDIFSIVETLDCRYLFSYMSVEKAKKLLESDIDKVKLENVFSAFEGLL